MTGRFRVLASAFLMALLLVPASGRRPVAAQHS